MNKLLFVLFAALLLASCKTSTHLLTMPFEPSFVKKGEVKANATAGIDHLDLQAATSITNNWGITGATYVSGRGLSCFETGINYFSALDKTKRQFSSVTFGYGRGRYNGSFDEKAPFGIGDNYKLDTKYRSVFIQFSFINQPINNKGRINVSFKYEFVYFDTYNFDIERQSTSGFSTIYQYHYGAGQKRTSILTPYVGYEAPIANSKFYYLAQLGLRLTNGFRIKYDTIKENKDAQWAHKDSMHPIISPLFLNFAFGLKIN